MKQIAVWLKRHSSILGDIFDDLEIGLIIYDGHGDQVYCNYWAKNLLQSIKNDSPKAKEQLTQSDQADFHLITDIPGGITTIYKCHEKHLENGFTMQTIRKLNLRNSTTFPSPNNLSQLAVFVLDRYGTITSCNRYANKIIPLPASDVIGTNFNIICNILEGIPQIDFNQQNERSVQCKAKIEEKEIWVQLTVTPQIDKTTLSEQIITIANIEDLMTAQKEIAHQEKLATLGQLAAGLAHEVKNPLTGVRGFLQLIELYLNRNNKDKLTHYLKAALEETDNLHKLINDFLDYAQPHDPQKMPIKTVDLLEEVGVLISSACYLHSISFSIELPEQHKDLTLIADRHQLKQVLLNIANNAVEALQKQEALQKADDKYLTIKVARADHLCSIGIENNGPQITEQVIQNIFDPFFTTKDHGTGLGLSTCARLIRENGGLIEVKSTPKKTAFHVYVPINPDN